jgi:FkbM family methyltransferase
MTTPTPTTAAVGFESTRYFLLTKPADGAVDRNDRDQIVYLNSDRTFLLPATNLTYYRDHGLFENWLIEWSRQFCRPDALFLDIGAHTGTYTVGLASSCAAVYAFEPQKMTYYALCGSVALSRLTNVTCVPFGLGSPEQVGTATLNIRSQDGGGSSVCALPAHEVLATETIAVRTLDSVFQSSSSNEDATPISFIKMDVEYNELNVLKGAVETLRRHRYPTLLFEANDDAASEQNRALMAFLEQDLNYRTMKVQGTQNMYLAVNRNT